MKDIPGYKGLYALTKDGRVWSYPKHWSGGKHKGKWLVVYKASGKKNLDSYWGLSLQKNSKQKFHLIHRLLAKTYIPNPKNLPQVNHRDGDKSNNIVLNLEWATPSQNQLHSFKIGTNHQGIDHHNAKLTPNKVREIRTGVIPGTRTNGFESWARRFKVDANVIKYVYYGRFWRHVI